MLCIIQLYMLIGLACIFYLEGLLLLHLLNILFQSKRNCQKVSHQNWLPESFSFLYGSCLRMPYKASAVISALQINTDLDHLCVLCNTQVGSRLWKVRKLRRVCVCVCVSVHSCVLDDCGQVGRTARGVEVGACKPRLSVTLGKLPLANSVKLGN